MRAAVAAIGTMAFIVGYPYQPVMASLGQRPPQPAAAQRSPAPSGSFVPDAKRSQFLGTNWKKSKDRAWTTAGDADGFHILVAEKKSGYTWRTAASLSEPGFDADMWIGNVCVTGSGRRAVAAYAPRTFTNKADLMARGAFAAIVDLVTGKVTKLNRQVSLAYFSPGCGLGETAVLTQGGGETKNATRLIKVNAATGKLSKPIQLAGQVTSAVPVSDGIVAADSARLVRIDNSGARTPIASTAQIPFLLKPDAQGGVVYLDRPNIRAASAAAEQGEVRRVDAAAITHPKAESAKPALLATGALARIDLTSSADGRVYITGDASTAKKLPASVRRQQDLPKDSLLSTHGEAAVTRTARPESDVQQKTMKSVRVDSRVKVTLNDLGTRRRFDFSVAPRAAGVARSIEGGAPSPLLRTKTVSATGTVEDARTCSVARNDPAKQAMQPKPRQVEWAVNQAITKNLNQKISRPANWKNLGMAAYQPQTLFQLKDLDDGGRVPSQVMLGITAQESNMWQAARFVVPGVTGNPLIGNYYGIQYNPNGTQTDPWAIDWSKSDCGYGVVQVTDGMKRTSSSPSLKQEAVALDYTANIAAGVNVLIDKWNQTRRDGLVIDNGDPKYAENWFYALWAYNSGYHPSSEAGSNGGAWGVGFTNNPANPLWKANRTPFLEGTGGGDNYTDASHPQDWPYQEKVLGWAGHPLFALESPDTMVAGYRAAWWNTVDDRVAVKPVESLFCTSANECDASKIGPNDSNDPGMGACTRADLKCWWHQKISWKSCAAGHCANEILRFDSTYGEQADGTAYPPNCSTSGLPSSALVIDNVPDGTPIHRPSCSVPKASSGTFSFTFSTDSARMDLHQLGAGYSGHFWFAHTRKDTSSLSRLKVTGTWELNSAINKWGRVRVHIPDHGAQTQQAHYRIYRGSTFVGERVIPTKYGSNAWVDLGVFDFRSTTAKPRIVLDNETVDGTGDVDVAWDAIAVQPLTAKPKHFVVSLGDSYSSGEGAGSYYPVSDTNYGKPDWNACRRSSNAAIRKVVLPGLSRSIGAEANDQLGDTQPLDYHSVACSGALTYTVDTSGGMYQYPGYDGQFNEIAQLDSGFVDSNTTLVVLTLGGNDAGFSKVVSDCQEPFVDCPSDGKVKGDIDSAVTDLQRVVARINTIAPNARILLLGYPNLFDGDNICAGTGNLSRDDLTKLNAWGQYMSVKQASMVANLPTPLNGKVNFYSPNDRFAGHRVCQNESGINGIVLGQEGPGDFKCPNGTTFCVSRESFHPNSTGTSLYSQAIGDAITLIGYNGN